MVNSRLEKKKRKGRRLKRVLFVFLTLFLAVVAYGGYVFFETFRAANQAYTELDRDKSKYRDTQIEINKDPFSVLIMGIEDYSTGGQNGRTDTLIVATLNPEEKTMKLLSIPRDTQVYYEHLGYYSKINHAHAYGGKEMTIEKVEELLEVPIDYFTTVNFEGFKNIIDIIGGVEVEVPFDFTENSDVDNSTLYFTEGKMQLSGEEALAYARMRKQDPRNDFGRNDRQKQIIQAAISNVLSPGNLFKVDDIAKEMGENVETNIRVTEGIGLSKLYAGFNSSNMENLTLEGADDTSTGTYYFIPYDESIIEVRSAIKNHLGLENTTVQSQVDTD
ncbi:LCP family protein [Sutcliffiella rhizosphaerae]|uniref:Polyisoprenyl-teichoic acid--peptidoglycan teichoic acid transferase TagV n=1 Tax=Sutcliffiella rhizosphaerae TaxID=2880967 RepID=A0ABM8YNE4_9BACI|nr:LCP family protein [Sutcliffiella rhizosphaerae]CAG9621423.1 Polyisoprenyl-teichoic acid--peptidoglycan teichoic acid transferase TagV [Sutcliffiella rhizosphaerae]